MPRLFHIHFTLHCNCSQRERAGNNAVGNTEKPLSEVRIVHSEAPSGRGAERT